MVLIVSHSPENDRLPDDWNWMDVADRLKTEKCFANIAGNVRLYSRQNLLVNCSKWQEHIQILSQVENSVFLQTKSHLLLSLNICTFLTHAR